MENRFDLIERYLMNEMSVREQLEFEDLLRNDPGLMKEFLLRKDINDAIIEEDVINLRDTLNEVVKDSSSKRIKLTYVYSAVAAVMVLFIVIASIYIFPLNKVENVDIFNSYYSTYPSVMSLRSSEELSETEQLMHKGIAYYDKGQYDKASEIFESILKIDTENYMVQFYLSICEIEEDNLGVAEEYLNDLIQKKDNLFWEQSNWYLALVYLKQNQMDKAESLLKQIIHENMSYKSDAELILKILY